MKNLFYFIIALLISVGVLVIGNILEVGRSASLVYVFIGSLFLGFNINKKIISWSIFFALFLVVLVSVYHSLFEIRFFSLQFDCIDRSRCLPVGGYFNQVSLIHLLLGPLGALLGSKLKKSFKK